MIKVKGIKELQAKLENTKYRLDIGVHLGLMETAFAGTAIAKQHTKGQLRDATYAEATGPHSVRIISNKFYAKWFEYGNGVPGGRIYPISAKALCFHLNGKTIFAKSVKTSKPHPYMSLAYAWVKDNAIKIVKKNIMISVVGNK